MLNGLLIAVLVLAAGGIVIARLRRVKLYATLGDRLARLANLPSADLGDAALRALPDFKNRLVVLTGFLPERLFTALKVEAERLVSPERSYVPTHKKGGTIAYETLIASAPEIVSFYQSPRFIEIISRITGERLVPTPIYDQSSLSVLVYERPGDHIGWHYDHNFYRGRHFTVLIALDNRGRAEEGLSHATLMARAGGEELSVRTAPNTMVVFEGAAVRHKVTPILEGERRLILSMTYCTNPGATLWQGVSRRIKDTAFFGMRALWT